MRSKYPYNFKIRDKENIIITILCKPVIITFTIIVLLFYFNGITESVARLSNDSSNSSNCPSSIINAIQKVNVLPPRIVMIYDGKVYQGQLSESKFRGGETISQLNIQPRNLTTNLPPKIVQVKEGSCVLFAIIGTPRLLPPSSLAVTAYASNNGTAVKVLNAADTHTSIFRVNLVRGSYVLLAVGTWLPGSEQVSGYAIYKFAVNVVL
jgi:hypothetical protein